MGAPKIGVGVPFEARIVKEKDSPPVFPGTPAAEAKGPFMLGDRIKLIDDKKVESFGQLNGLLAERAGQDLAVTVGRAKAGSGETSPPGDEETVKALKPLFECMGKTIVYQGAAGSGQHTKMVNQILIASNMVGVCEALLYGYKAGVNLETVMQSVSVGAAPPRP